MNYAGGKSLACSRTIILSGRMLTECWLGIHASSEAYNKTHGIASGRGQLYRKHSIVSCLSRFTLFLQVARVRPTFAPRPARPFIARTGGERSGFVVRVEASGVSLPPRRINFVVRVEASGVSLPTM